jgi:GNAT superfamily N-acetyltransferase
MGMSAAETTNVIVRLASPADAVLLAKLRFDLRASTHELREEETAFVDRCTRWMEQRLGQDGRWRCWIAECDGTVVGSVWVQLIEKIPNPIAEPEYYVYLTNLFVQPQHRGKGIGSKLLAAAVAWSRRNHAELVLLWPTERSKSLYSRHGFVAVEDFMELVL